MLFMKRPGKRGHRTARNKLDVLLTAVIILIAVVTALMIYLSNFKSIALDLSHYASEYERLGVAASFDEGTDLAGPTAELISYLEHGTDVIETDFFNVREKSHMEEVRVLFDGVFRILDFAVVFLNRCNRY